MSETSLTVLFSQAEIEKRIRELAGEIVTAFSGTEPVLIGLLNGCYVFLADLTRELYRQGMSLRLDFMSISSYGEGRTSSGEPNLLKDVEITVSGHPVLLVDDIIETGHSLEFAAQRLLARGAMEVKTCVLLDKPGKRRRQCDADFTGFTIGDEFVVGYGLDFAGRYRELPGIWTLENE